MKTKLVAPTIAAILLAAALTPAAGAESPCDDAVATFTEAFAEALFAFDPQIAQLLAQAAMACSAVTSGDQPPEPVRAIQGIANGAHAVVNNLLAKGCGLRGTPAVSAPQTALLVFYTATTFPPVAKTETEYGEAVSTYQVNTNATTFSNHGVNWSLDAANTGSPTYGLGLPRDHFPGFGIVWLHGVPIPAVYPSGHATAEAGCTGSTVGQVCWGEGKAEVTLTTFVTIKLESRFDLC